MKKSTIQLRKKIQKHKSRRMQQGGGIFSSADDNKVTISYDGKPIKCTICGSVEFQQRDGTIGKSKTNQVMFSFFTSNDTAEALNDMSVRCYYCNTCGYAYIVRNPATTAEQGTYTNLIKSSPA